eukprot:TRINITY_DN10772_c2_g1_i1.p1 TRINITY_DN10772_c2_g1~~TRINITY_DN10772_c2_g1_i1.p1  ORF type:complete len:261 (-),score=56.25 TRINITY_DN10772_c2_g1_i1:100-882(-)
MKGCRRSLPSWERQEEVVPSDRPLKAAKLAVSSLKLLHITKNAGTAIENWGLAFGCRWGRRWSEVKKHVDALLPPHEGRLRSEWWHIPPQFFKEDPYKGFDTFAVVRCPYRRAISEFRCPWKGFEAPVGKSAERRLRRNQATAKNLNEWLQLRLRRGGARPPFRNGHFIPQHFYIFNENGDLLMPEMNLLRFENLEEDCFRLVERYSLQQPPPLLHVNESDMPRFSIDDLTSETRLLIEEEYAKDFELLKYPKAMERKEE